MGLSPTPPDAARPLRPHSDAVVFTETWLQEKVQWRRMVLLLLLGINYTMVAMNHALPSFHGFTPNFHCQNQSNATEAPTNTPTIEDICSSEDCLYEFDEHDGAYTVVEEWQLICGKRVLTALTASLYYGGVTIGAVMVGVAADVWGRRLPLLATLYIQAAFCVAIFFANSLPLFVALRFFQGFFVQGLQGVTYAYLMEVFPTRWRTALAAALELCWACGLALLAAADYHSPTWRHLQLAVASPVLLSVAYVSWMPESPRWLAVRGRHEEALAAWIKLAPKGKMARGLDADDKTEDANAKAADMEMTEMATPRAPRAAPGAPNAPVAPGADANAVANAPTPTNGAVATAKAQPGNKSLILELLRQPMMRKTLFIMMFSWFSVSLSYYGVTLYMPALAGKRHFNFFVSALVEAGAYLLTFVVLTCFGRRRPLSAYMLLSGVLCIAVGAVAAQPEHSSAAGAVRSTLTLAGKAALVSAFCCLFLYTTELFPTVLRAAAMGACGFASRIGSLAAPQLLLLGDYTSPVVPLVAMGMVTLTAGACILMLPETHGQPLPDTIEQAQMLCHSKQESTRV